MTWPRDVGTTNDERGASDEVHPRNPLGEMRVKDGSYEVAPAGVLTVTSDDQTTLLSHYAWLRIAHDNDEPPLSPVGG